MFIAVSPESRSVTGTEYSIKSHWVHPFCKFPPNLGKDENH